MVGTGTALLVGSGAIALGVLTYSRGVMTTVGKRITSMSDFAALTATLAMDITVHIFTWVGVPVSTSQAIVGSVVGVGLVKSTRSIDLRVIVKIGVGWLGAIVLSLAFTLALLKLGKVVF
jgi:PiT family inorganic phosphate transporter